MVERRGFAFSTSSPRVLPGASALQRASVIACEERAEHKASSVRRLESRCMPMLQDFSSCITAFRSLSNAPLLVVDSASELFFLDLVPVMTSSPVSVTIAAPSCEVQSTWMLLSLLLKTRVPRIVDALVRNRYSHRLQRGIS